MILKIKCPKCGETLIILTALGGSGHYRMGCMKCEYSSPEYKMPTPITPLYKAKLKIDKENYERQLLLEGKNVFTENDVLDFKIDLGLNKNWEKLNND